MQQASRITVQQQQRIPADRSRENLVHARYLSLQNLRQSSTDFVNRMHGNPGHLQHYSSPRQFRQSAGGTPVPDVDQFGERVMVRFRNIHAFSSFTFPAGAAKASTVEMVSRTCSVLKGLVKYPAAPAALASACVAV